MPARWTAVRENCLTFCTEFSAEAHLLGWTAPELFAVHPQHGTIRVDYCGVLMMGAEPARGVEANRVLFERPLGYRSRPG